MIHARDLRIGNLIYIELGLPSLNIHEIKAQDIADIANGRITLNSIEGIPLSEDWLKKCGFTLHDNVGYMLRYNGLRCALRFVRWEPNEPFLQVDSPFGSTTLKYVHELQNWFYALTSQELKIEL